MVIQKFSAGHGQSYSLPVPESVEEFDKLSGEAGAALREAIQNVQLRSVNTTFRRELTKEIEARTKLPLLTKTITGANGKVEEERNETDGAYYKRVLATVGPGLSREDAWKLPVFDGLVDAIMAKVDKHGNKVVVFDPSAREPGEGVGLAKKWKDAAVDFLVQARERNILHTWLAKRLSEGVLPDDFDINAPSEEDLVEVVGAYIKSKELATSASSLASKYLEEDGGKKHKKG